MSTLIYIIIVILTLTIIIMTTINISYLLLALLLIGGGGTLAHNEDQMRHPALGSFFNPASACKLISQDSLSGHYWIQHTGTGYANLEYCDMTRTCCNSTGGWMRVAHLNFTDTNQKCPSGFRLITSPKRTCGTPGNSYVSSTFPLNGVKYTPECVGRSKPTSVPPLMHLFLTTSTMT